MLLWRSRWLMTLLLAVAGCGSSYDGGSSGKPGPGSRNDLSAMDTTVLTINGQRIQAWVAKGPDRAGAPDPRQLGLMRVTAEELAPLPDGTLRGMLFIFEQEQPLFFWMRNTITPLDIAYIRTDGEIVRTWTMAPLETLTYPSVEPAQFALEVLAGEFERLNIRAGDRVEIPESVLKRTD